MTTDSAARHGETRWWLIGLAGSGAVLALFTPWAVVVQAALLVLAVSRLTSRPPRAERFVLVVAVVLLAGVLLTQAVAALGAFMLEGTTSGTSVEVG